MGISLQPLILSHWGLACSPVERAVPVGIVNVARDLLPARIPIPDEDDCREATIAHILFPFCQGLQQK